MTDWPSFPNFRSSPLPEMPEIRFVSLTVDQITALPDSELLRVLSGEYDDGAVVPGPLQQLVAAELQARALAAASKPHWSVVPAFWLIVATAILALVAAAAAVLALPQVQQLLRP
jgi:hypothetical protein